MARKRLSYLLISIISAIFCILVFTHAVRAECIISCVPQSIACAWSWAVKYRTEVRIAVQKIRPGVDHSQAQVLIDGEWKPLVMKWTKHGPVAYPGHKHFNVEPYRYLTLREWIDEQVIFTDLN